MGQELNILVWGVTGTGKTTVASQLAATLNWRYLDADDFHPPTNIRKLRDGIPLTDDDRRPWLASIRQRLDTMDATGVNSVLACSALKRQYRDQLGVDESGLRSVLLTGSFELISERLQQRPDHFMNTNLLQSQFDTLEIESGGLVFDVSLSVEAIVKTTTKIWNLS